MMLVKYKCLKCGQITETGVVCVDDNPELKCQYCGSCNTELITFVQILYKGEEK